MKRWFAATLVAGLITSSACFAGLQMNGIAAQEQLRKEFYIGALYLETLSKDPAAITAQASGKRMVLHVTADRWSPMQFAQQWNQMILINNGGAVVNANVMDVLNFTSVPKSDLVAGDELTIELDRGASVVMLNGTTVVRTTTPNLFNMLLNTWVGARPPSSDFKRDMLALPNDKAGVELRARYDSIKPSDARRKLTAGWGVKEAEAVATIATPAPATPLAMPTATPVPKPKAETPPAEAKKAPLPAPEKTVAAAPHASTPPKPVEPQVDQAAAQNKRAQQQALYADYSNQLRRQVHKNLTYPKRAVKQNLEGLVVIKVSVARSGALMASAIAQSADEMLDQAALDAIKKGTFPPVTEALEGNSFDFLVPVVFKLTAG